MSYEPLPPFAATAGARQPRMVLLGEAWGGDEADQRRPFVGAAGRELFLMLGEAMPEVEPELHARVVAKMRYGSAWVGARNEWFEAAGIGLTNVLALRPPGNKLELLCQSRKELEDPHYDLPAIAKGKYLHPQYVPELQRLYAELATWAPNLIVALGNTACWAALRATNIGSIRGAVAMGTGGQGVGRTWLASKVLPTYHPAGVLRQWNWRPIVVSDLMKAHREAQFAEIRRPQRQVLVDPTIGEVQQWAAATLAAPPPMLSCDIETEFGQVKCVGFARSVSDAIVVPFVDKTRPGWSYWPDPGQERAAWDAVAGLIEHPRTRLLGQNFIYDTQYLNPLGINCGSLAEDTMLLHHSIWPEMQKGLGFLGSIYTSETSWKLMRRQKADTEKREE